MFCKKTIREMSTRLKHKKNTKQTEQKIMPALHVSGGT